ncbi:hypothetical protein D3C71_1456190 [compost metagenome]
MRQQAAVVVAQAKHERRAVQAHEDPLRPILEIPAARVVMFIVAVDEVQDLGVGNGFARAALPGLALRMQAPPAASVQRQPAKHRRHVGPAGECVLYRLIHVQGRMMMEGGVMTMAGAAIGTTT